jgi:hypothetical protein
MALAILSPLRAGAWRKLESPAGPLDANESGRRSDEGEPNRMGRLIDFAGMFFVYWKNLESQATIGSLAVI